MNWKRILKLKIKETKYTENEWIKAFDLLPQIRHRLKIEDHEIKTLVDHISSPKQFQFVLEIFHNFDSYHQQKNRAYLVFAKHIDNSRYSLTEWVEALESIYLWLENKNKSANFDFVLQYLSCSAQAVENKAILPSFSQLVDEMLNSYGFDGPQ